MERLVLESALEPCDAAINSEDAEEEHWNGVWYGTSEDYDLDSDAGDCILEMGETEGASCSESDDSDVHSIRDSRRPSFFRRACNTILFPNEVHAAS